MDALADRVLTGPVALGQSAIHDDHHGRVGAVGVGESAAAKDGDAGGRQVVAEDLRGPRRVQFRALGRGITLGMKAVLLSMPLPGRAEVIPTVWTPGNCWSLESRAELNASTAACEEYCSWEAVSGGEYVIGAEAEVDGAEFFKTAQQEARAD